MGRKSSIDEETGTRLIEAYGRLGSKRAAAEEAGVSIGSAMRYFESLPEAAAPVVAQQQHLVAVHGASLWDTRSALDENYSRLLKLASQLETGIYTQQGEQLTLTPVATNVAAIREIREHIKTSMDLAKLLIDVEEVRKFQQAVIDAIGEADEETRRRILAKLRERRALGLAL